MGLKHSGTEKLPTLCDLCAAVFFVFVLLVIFCQTILNGKCEFALDLTANDPVQVRAVSIGESLLVNGSRCQ